MKANNKEEALVPMSQGSDQANSPRARLVYWKFFTDVANEKKAAKVVKWVLARLEDEANHSRIEPYHKGGFTISFCTMPSATSWADLVVKALSSAERVGHGWILSGSIAENLDVWCNSPSVPGVISIHVVCPHISKP